MIPIIYPRPILFFSSTSRASLEKTKVLNSPLPLQLLVFVTYIALFSKAAFSHSIHKYACFYMLDQWRRIFYTLLFF